MKKLWLMSLLVVFGPLSLWQAEARASGLPAATPPAAPVSGKGVSGSPTQLSTRADASMSRTLSAMQQGEALDLSKFQYWAGADARVERFTTFVIRDEEEWWQLWARLGGKNPPKPLPRNMMAVAIMLGPRPSDGYNVRITSMNKQDDSLHVSYIEGKPDGRPASTAPQSWPYVVMMAPLVDGRVRFFSLPAAGR